MEIFYDDRFRKLVRNYNVNSCHEVKYFRNYPDIVAELFITDRKYRVFCPDVFYVDNPVYVSMLPCKTRTVYVHLDAAKELEIAYDPQKLRIMEAIGEQYIHYKFLTSHAKVENIIEYIESTSSEKLDMCKVRYMFQKSSLAYRCVPDYNRFTLEKHHRYPSKLAVRANTPHFDLVKKWGYMLTHVDYKYPCSKERYKYLDCTKESLRYLKVLWSDNTLKDKLGAVYEMQKDDKRLLL